MATGGEGHQNMIETLTDEKENQGRTKTLGQGSETGQDN